MNDLYTILEERQVPELKSRQEMLKILQEQEYGFIPPAPESLTWEVRENVVNFFCAGKASYSIATLHCSINGKVFSFPVHCVIPTGEGKYPFFIHINFRSDVPDRYMPTEELVDNGFAILSIKKVIITAETIQSGEAKILREPDRPRVQAGVK